MIYVRLGAISENRGKERVACMNSSGVKIKTRVAAPSLCDSHTW